MPRMPETSINLPIPASGDIVSIAGHGLRRPRSEPESAVSSPLLATVSAYIDAQDCGEGLFPTPVDSINIIRSFQQRMPTRQIYRPSLCIVLQGAKQILFGEDVLDYGAMEYLLVSVALPAGSMRCATCGWHIGCTDGAGSSHRSSVRHQTSGSIRG